MARRISLAAVVILLASTIMAQAPSAEDQVWSREEAYWKYVQANDLRSYRALWDENFLGWPMSSPEPARKAQITNWIKVHTDKSESLKTYQLQRLVSQQTGDLVTITYRVSQEWAAKNGSPSVMKSRIIHTWMRGKDGTWRIISGMSAPVNSDGH